MRVPIDPLRPRGQVFEEPWHAAVLASAYAMVQAGHLSAGAWADALGAALERGAQAGRPDTEQSYYLAALEALETLVPIDAADLAQRKADWTAAYRRTPHGEQVSL